MPKRFILSIVLLVFTSWTLRAQDTYRYRYWFDGADSKAHEETVEGTKWHFNADISALNDALHTMYIQVQDTAGQWSAPQMRYFLKQQTKKDVTYAYWFDNDQTAIKGATLSDGVIELDVNELTDGFHWLNLQATGKGSESTPITRMFIKVPQTERIGEMTCVCSIDGTMYKQEKVPSEGGIVNWNLDINSLEQGLHRIMVQVLTPTGAASNVYNSFFFRCAKQEELNGMKFIYSIDGGEYGAGVGSTGNGLFHLDIDVASLADGLHRINYMLVGDKGLSTVARSQFFVKVSVGGNGIDSYKYWLNEDDAEVTTVKLPKRVSSLALVKLLPIRTVPLRSKDFHFEIDKNGKPVMYAKNDIHFQFVDASSKVAEVHKQYTDYSVRHDVEDITPLQATQTFARPKENSVKWFSFKAEEGDTVSFRSNQATALQVFSPSGKEVYSVKEDKSVEFGGCHTWENGTYYVALHDVTGSRQDVKLDFTHLEKYDVVAQDVKTVGNGGYNNITFTGNGFNELDSVVFVGKSRIVSDSIYHESDAKTSVRINFAGAELGTYTATFMFKDGTKVIENCINVEQAEDIVIKGNVNYASTYLRSRSNTYTIQLTNKSNMTAYDIPLSIFVYTQEENDLKWVSLNGYDLYKRYTRKLSEEDAKRLQDSVNTHKNISGDMYLFTKSMDNDYVEGYPALHKTIVPITLPSNSTQTFKVEIKAESTAIVYVWYPSEWEISPVATIANMRSGAKDGLCAILNRRASMCEENEMYKANGFGDAIYDVDCDNIKPSKQCPKPLGGSSTPVNSLDPNDIYGYTSESGSKFINDSIKNVNYRIEFENDTTFASAAAHTVEIMDTLDSRYFDLTTFAPISIKIGDKTEYLDGKANFVKTIDLRPDIYAIAQVEGNFDEKNGIASWTFTSLDPMTMEPAENIVQGFLPVNYDGKSGIGEVSFDIATKSGKDDGAKVNNCASIVFDSNEPIMTPVWTNTVDTICPKSSITNVEHKNDTTLTLVIESGDNRSGVWKHEIYAQYGTTAPWVKVAELGADSTSVDFRFYDGIDYGFCVLATDSAGNIEKKELKREQSFCKVTLGDVNKDGEINSLDASLISGYYIEEPVYILALAADINGDGIIDSMDATLTADMYLQKNNTGKARRATVTRQRIKKITIKQ